MARKTWLGVVLVALVAGGSVAVSTPSTGSRVQPITLTVASSAIGDVAEYVENGFSDYSDSWGGVSTWRGPGRFAIRVTQLVTALDNVGLPHPGVEIEYAGNNEVAVASGISNSVSSIQREVLSLETRDVLLRDRASKDPWYGTSSRQVIGPRFYTSPTGAQPGEVLRWLGNASWLADQGRTFALGDVLVNATVGPGTVESKVVALVGEYEGRLAIGVEHRLVYDQEGAGGWRYRGESTYTWWYAEGYGLPVRTEWSGTDNGTGSDGSYDMRWAGNTSIVAFTRGTSPIPWSAQDSSSVYLSRNPGLERSPPGQLHPADGTGIGLPFPLGAARASVEQDMSLVGFKAWRAQEPRAVLVGADYRPLERGADAPAGGFEWTLSFASPGGDAAFRVSSRLMPGLPPANREGGIVPLVSPSFDRRLPREVAMEPPVTIAEAIRMWRARLGPAGETQVPTEITWGYALLARCVRPSPSTTRPGDVCAGDGFFTPTTALGAMEVGQSSGVRSPDRAVPSPSGHESVIVSLNVTHGFVKNVLTRRAHWDFAGWSAATFGAPVNTKPNEAPAAPVTDARRWYGAAAVSTSVLGLFATVYFFPLVRELFARGLLALPFYAKLRKDDLFNNEMREAIANLVRADPGVDASQIHVRVGGGWSTVVYHLSVLEKNQIVSSLIDGRHKRFFPVGELDHGARPRIAALKNDRTRALFEMLSNEPGLDRRELASRLGMSVPGVLWHVERLTRAGLLGADKFGRNIRYFAAQEPRPPAAPTAPEIA